MMKRATPKRVTLPNSRTFAARYELITRNHLPANMHLRGPYKQRAAPCGRSRRPQGAKQGRGIGSILNIVKKFFKTPFVRELHKMTLNELLNLCSKGTNKIKNKKIKKIL